MMYFFIFLLIHVFFSFTLKYKYMFVMQDAKGFVVLNDPRDSYHLTSPTHQDPAAITHLSSKYFLSVKTLK